ncbi:hypothetical protein H7I87_03125 [Mycobacterium timonense]|uniref:Uncharacterized protein n=1 Tax=Mycobacterium bouchedurhonense TaxID=701041 RepID=A0AAW5SAF4_MYCBC|nr:MULTISPECIES: hypothetical protein [Mycobacterium avium complex (MAC)]MCV6992103.1 hypothetical protein [Mycobacterium bouchedurhonense]MCV6993723.1 hypothetical protein [Mycobacterium timonense]
MAADERTGLLERLAVASLVAEAEDLTRGVRYLSVATGDPETDDDLARVNTLTAAAWTPRPGAATTSIRGGNDYLTIRVEGFRRGGVRRRPRRAGTDDQPWLLAHHSLTAPLLSRADDTSPRPSRAQLIVDRADGLPVDQVIGSGPDCHDVQFVEVGQSAEGVGDRLRGHAFVQPLLNLVNLRSGQRHVSPFLHPSAAGQRRVGTCYSRCSAPRRAAGSSAGLLPATDAAVFSLGDQILAH